MKARYSQHVKLLTDKTIHVDELEIFIGSIDCGITIQYRIFSNLIRTQI
jgi:hypothetical protein